MSLLTTLGRLRHRLSDAAARRGLSSAISATASGRRHMLLMSVALMTAAMLATALLPTHAQIGAAAGWLLFLLRCVMGFSVGGEYTGVVAYLLEGAPLAPPRPDRIAGLGGERSRRLARGRRLGADRRLARRGQPAKLGLAHPLPGRRGAGGNRLDRALDDGGIARVPPAGRRAAPCPQARSATASTNHRGAIGRAFAISALGSITYYVGITYVPAFLTSAGSLTERAVAVAFDRRGGGGHPGHAFRRRFVRPDRAEAGAGDARRSPTCSCPSPCSR